MESKVKIWFDTGNIFYQDELGEIFNHSLNDLPRLKNANSQARLEFELSPFGIHWPKLDEDLSFEGFKQQFKLAHK